MYFKLNVGFSQDVVMMSIFLTPLFTVGTRANGIMYVDSLQTWQMAVSTKTKRLGVHYYECLLFASIALDTMLVKWSHDDIL